MIQLNEKQDVNMTNTRDAEGTGAMLNFKTKPFEHQVKIFEQFKDKNFFALFCDMGTGKTKVLIDIACHKYLTEQIDSVLIIAPNNVHSQWINEQLKIHCSLDYNSFTWSSSKVKQKYYSNLLDKFITDKTKIKFFAVNVEAFQSNTVLPYIQKYILSNKVFTIIDESTRIKNPNAKRSKAIMKLNRFGQRAIATGTPVASSPLNLWSMFTFLQDNYFDCNYFMFQHRYAIMVKATNNNMTYNTFIDEKTFNIIKNIINRIKSDGSLTTEKAEELAIKFNTQLKNIYIIDSMPVYSKYKNVDELKEIIKKDTFTIKKEQCVDLPEKIYQTCFIEMGKEQRVLYNTLRKELYAEYNEKELTVTNKIALSLRLQQVAGGFFPSTDKTSTAIEYPEKVKFLLSELEELGNSQAIIWAHFRAEIDFLYDEISKEYSCVKYYGNLTQTNKEDAIKNFKEGNIQFLIGNIQTAGIGLNLQNASYQFFYSNSFNVEDRIQAESRTHRIGAKNTCVYKDLISKNTIDTKILNAIKNGKSMSDMFMTLSDFLDTCDEGEEE